MVSKKTKASPKSNGMLAPTHSDERAARKNVEESPALVASISIAEPVAAVEPVAEKSVQVAKKGAKTKVAAPIETAEPDETPVEIPAKKSAKDSKEQPEKSVKMKRLTLDISKPLHKAIKAKAVEDDIPMVDMLRSLLEKYYGKG